VVFRQHIKSLAEGRRVGGGGAGSNYIQRIADNIGKNEGYVSGRMDGFREPPTLDAGEVLSDGVEFIDIRPGLEQQVGCFLLFSQRN